MDDSYEFDVFVSQASEDKGETESARAEAERVMQAVANQPAGSRFRTDVERIAARLLNHP